MTFKITTLIENNPAKDNNFAYEHGLSLYIEKDDLKILFDTGQSGAFLDNADKLNVPLNELDYLIMSHGHYDHSGGFKRFMPYISEKTKIIIGEGFFDTKCKALADGKYKMNGNSFTEEDLVDNHLNYQFISDDFFMLDEDLFIFKNFKQTNDYEIIPNKFLIKENETYHQDTFKDEIALGIKTAKGLVVIVGCSHRGIVNILSDIQTKIDLPIVGLIGGTHLVEADESRIQKTITYLDSLNLDFVAFSHCTGPAIDCLGKHFKDKFIFNNTANIIKY